MTLIEFNDVLATMRKHNVQSASVEIFGAKVAVAFEPVVPAFIDGEPEAGAWKRSPVTEAAPPNDLDLPAIWGDEPETKE